MRGRISEFSLTQLTNVPDWPNSAKLRTLRNELKVTVIRTRGMMLNQLRAGNANLRSRYRPEGQRNVRCRQAAWAISTTAMAKTGTAALAAADAGLHRMKDLSSGAVHGACAVFWVHWHSGAVGVPLRAFLNSAELPAKNNPSAKAEGNPKGYQSFGPDPVSGADLRVSMSSHGPVVGFSQRK